MKRDIFRRNTRMQHFFGETEKKNDPLMSAGDTFEPTFPIIGNNMSNRRNNSPPIEIQQFGRHDMGSPSRSPIQKPTGNFASLNGPAPDWAEAVGAPVPASTKMRTQPVVGMRLSKDAKKDV